MGETEDPRAALLDKAVSVRAAAVRDLSRDGDLDDALHLIGVASADKSASVRLVAAAGAAEILMRHRGARGQERLSAERVAEVERAVGAVDPAFNPSLLMCLAAIPDARVIQRLTRALRDPRNGVRAAAAAALRRMALSGAATREPTGLREWIAEALDHPKLPADALVELVRLIGDVGWVELGPRIRKRVAKGVAAEPRAPAALGELVELALARLDERARPDAWLGVWVDDGLDVLQVGEPSAPRWRVIDAELAARVENGRLHLPDGLARRIWAPRLKEEGVHAAIQVDGATWWRMEGPALVKLIEDLDATLGEQSELGDVVAGALEGVSGAAADRARAILFVRTGRHAEALALTDELLASKKPRNDVMFLRGKALLGLGRVEEGRAALAAYLEKAKRKEPWRAEAEALST